MRAIHSRRLRSSRRVSTFAGHMQDAGSQAPARNSAFHQRFPPKVILFRYGTIPYGMDIHEETPCPRNRKLLSNVLPIRH
jgi:hypothetical protein